MLVSERASIRAWYQIKIAKPLAIGTLIIGLLMPIHKFIFYVIHNTLCSISPGSIYKYVFAGYLLIVVSVLPHLLMLIFCLITVLPIKRSRNRVAQAGMIVNGLNHRRPRSFEVKLFQV